MARDIEAGRAYVRVSAKDDLSKGLRRISGKLKTWGATVAGIGTKMIGVGAAMGAPFLAAIKAASDMEETMNKFNVVFGESADEVKAWSDGFAASVGRSKKQIADFMAGSQDLFVPLGFAADAARDLSEQITGLAVDLASFNNLADDFVLRDLHAALTGSGEVMKKYGVIVSEAAVKQELLNQGMDPKTATDQMKVQARLNIILRGTTAAQGDALRSAGSFANQMKALRGTLHDTAVAIGSALLPVVTPLVTRLTEGVKLVADWASANQGLVRSIAYLAVGVVAAGGALLTISLGLHLASIAATVAAVATTAFTGALAATKVALLALATPVGLVVAGLGGLGVAFATMTDEGRWATSELAEDFKTARDNVQTMIAGMADAMSAGDLGLAMRIGMAGVKAAFVDAVRTMHAVWIEFNRLAVAGARNLATNVAHIYKAAQIAGHSLTALLAVSQLKMERAVRGNPVMRWLMRNEDARMRTPMSDEEYNRRSSDIDRAATGQISSEISELSDMVRSIDAFTATVDDLLVESGVAFTDGADALREELAALRSAARDAADLERRGRADRPGGAVAAAMAAAGTGASAGTFSAIAAQIMFAGQSDTEKKIEENTRESSRSLRRMERWILAGGPTFA